MKKFFKFIFELIIFLVLSLGFFWFGAKYITEHQIVTQENNKTSQKIIELSEPVQVNYQWKYKGVNYKISETLYTSLYNFYQNSPKSFKYEGELPSNWEEKYYAMFLKKTNNDESIKNIVANLKQSADKNKLTEDQTVELALAFVQSLAYDESKAMKILAGSRDLDVEISYPYETLFEKKGVCSDKSILLSALLKELGYGNALLIYESQKHMAVGIQCPKEYSNYESGYCYAETTAEGFRIGIIPDIDAKRGKAIDLKEFSYYNESQISQFDEQRLGEVKIFPQFQGKIYVGIAQSYALAKEIDNLRSTLNSLSKTLTQEKKDLDTALIQIESLGKKMDKLKKNGDYEEYNNLVSKYNKMVKDYEKERKIYNQKVEDYNQKVKRYNTLIKSF